MAAKSNKYDVLLCSLIAFLVLMVVGFAGFSAYTILSAINAQGAEYLPGAKGGATRTLFPNTAQVIDLTSADLTVVGDPRANRCPWLITFYSDGCGHCRSAAPKIGNIAHHFARLGDVTASTAGRQSDGLTETAVADSPIAQAAFNHQVILSGVLNCVQFGVACSKEEVRGVPTVKLFLPSTRPTSTVKRAGAMARQTAQLGSSEATVLAVGRAWSDYRGRTLKDWSDEDTQICRDIYRSLVQDKQMRIEAAAAKKTSNTTKHRTVQPGLPGRLPSGGGGSTASPAVTPNDTFKEYRLFAQSDVANAYFSTLYQEVALKGVPDTASYTALTNFLWRVHDHLPGLPASGLLLFLTKHLPLSARGELTTSFNSTLWQEVVLEAGIPIRGTPTNLEWLTCRGSSWAYRGFPCGMWLLYHTLTVAESCLNGAAALSSSSPSSVSPSSDGTTGRDVATSATTSPRQDTVLLEILDYARHFFVCEQCRQHFLRFTPTPNEDPALQLWRVHNRVNYYLQRPEAGRGQSGASDPAVPKRQFPTVLDCPTCYRDPQHTPVEVTDTNLPDEVYNLSEVLVFIRTRYAWQPQTLWTAESALSGRPHRGPLSGAANARTQTAPSDFNVLMTMLTVVLFVGCGLAYSLTRHRARTRASRRPTKPLV